MSKKHYVELIRNSAGCTVATANAILDAFLGGIIEELELHGETSIPEIGTLRVIAQAARTGRNPATGETVQIPEKRAVKFTVNSGLKRKMNPQLQKA